MILKSCVLFCALLSSSTVLAKDWVMVSGTLRFSGSQQEEPFRGEFKRFTPRIRFDPATPASAQFDVVIDLTSADSQQEERDSAMQAEEWFHTEAFPSAKFEAASATAKADGSFAISARLDLRGIKKDLEFPFTWSEDAAKAHLRAEVTLNRLDFDLGAGDWADPEWVGHNVRVEVDLILKPAPP